VEAINDRAAYERLKARPGEYAIPQTNEHRSESAGHRPRHSQRKVEAMPIQIDERMTVREIVGRHSKTRKVFERYGIDYCCGGRKRLVDAASGGRMSIPELTAALVAADDTPDAASGTEDSNWFEGPLR
jgi:hypothetical protein